MEPENNLSAGISLQEYIAILRRRRMIILNLFVIIAVVGVIVTLMTKPIYHARRTILFTRPASAKELNALRVVCEVRGVIGKLNVAPVACQV